MDPQDHYGPDNYGPDNYGPDHYGPDHYDQQINYNETGTVGPEIVTFFQIFLGLLSFSGCIQVFYINFKYCANEYTKRRKIKKRKIKEDELLLSDCVICLETYVIGESISILSCGHFFHSKCLNEWFEKKEDCPLCRLEI